ncbi:hypothetical protein MSAN_01516700 [Mycena sanguinolenta]|uniref:Uncharacterized protein n=1 Tax=Mycena sanguinolenta TaxID=230812 RepID=A0A8H6Y7J1_9AGAR|nr:hypothetical protein MSAN_01516700 [Mycena sanguinolenta]
MSPQAESDEEFIVLSTSDYADSESTSHPKNVEPFIKPFNFLPSLLRGSFKISGMSEACTRKYSETKPRRQATEHTVNKYYSYHITGGFGGSGGEGSDQGGNGGAGQGPTVYFGHPRDQESSDFRTIRRGDLKLVKEVHLGTESIVMGRLSRGVCVRRIHHAKIRGDPGIVTVAVYQGDGAEEEWRKDIAKYESIWHPYIMQLCGLVNTERLYAMVFHDGLIPYDQFIRCFEHSPILKIYISGYCTTEYREATDYIYDVIGPSMERSVWIRSSTGQLCLDLAQGGPGTSTDLNWWGIRVLHLENISLDAPKSEDMIISSLSEDQYHELDSQQGTFVRITEPLHIFQEEPHWDHYGRALGELLPNSWIRYDSHRTNTLLLELELPFWEHRSTKAWLAQANCIFAQLEEAAHVEDYVCINYLQFRLQIANKHHIPEGYLFVCPAQDFRTNTEPHANLYQWPACPGYWSLNPSGADRLSTEDARILGFPAIHIETVMIGDSWDCSVYEGLRQFHEGKGFDPDSREVARQLGYPLFEWDGMEATVPPVQMWNHQYAASGSSVDLSLAIGLIAGGVAMVMRSAASLMARLVNAIFDVTLLLADLALCDNQPKNQITRRAEGKEGQSLSAREAMTEPLLLRGTAQSRRERTMDVVDEDADALGGGTPLIHDVADDLDDLERDELAWSSSDTTPARSQIEEKKQDKVRLYERLATPSCSRSAKNAHSTANVGDKRREDGGTKARENKNTPAAADPTSTQYPPYSLPCSFSPCAALLLRLSSLLQDYAKSKGDQDRIQRIFRVYSPSIYGPWSVQRSAVAGEIDIVVLLAGF